MIPPFPRIPSSRHARLARLGSGLLVGTLALPGATSAQETGSPLVPGGRMRIDVGAEFVSWDTRFGLRTESGGVIEEEEPLGFDLTSDRVGTDLFPQLSGLEDLLVDALGDPSFQLRMGLSRAFIAKDQIRIPLRADVGVTDWLTVGAMVPFVKTRVDALFDFGADPASANLGASPGLDDPGIVSTFLGDLQAAIVDFAQRTQEICAASGEGSTECRDARNLLEEGREFQSGVAWSYGLGVIPLGGSAAGEALTARLQQIGAGFAARGASSPPSSLPLASTVLDGETFARLVQDPGLGIAGDPLDEFTGLWEVGDVEVSAAVRLLSGVVPGEADGPARLRYQLAAGGLVRLPTGRADSAANFLDVGSGDGQTDVELRLFGQMTFRDRFGLTADARWGIQREGTVTRRASGPAHVLVPSAWQSEVAWDPGDYVRLELTPRFHLTREFSVGARYAYWSKGADAYELRLSPEADPAPGTAERVALLELETEETLQEVGIGMVFSTRDAWREGTAPLPFEVQGVYRTAISGTGGLTPATSHMQISLRLFWRLWGSDPPTLRGASGRL